MLTQRSREILDENNIVNNVLSTQRTFDNINNHRRKKSIKLGYLISTNKYGKIPNGLRQHGRKI